VNLNANKIRKDPVPLIYRGFLPEKVEKNPKEKQWDQPCSPGEKSCSVEVIVGGCNE